MPTQKIAHFESSKQKQEDRQLSLPRRTRILTTSDFDLAATSGGSKAASAGRVISDSFREATV
jgi:hypothetical protein